MEKICPKCESYKWYIHNDGLVYCSNVNCNYHFKPEGLYELKELELK